jgi:hypothetical protein
LLAYQVGVWPMAILSLAAFGRPTGHTENLNARLPVVSAGVLREHVTIGGSDASAFLLALP